MDYFTFKTKENKQVIFCVPHSRVYTAFKV